MKITAKGVKQFELDAAESGLKAAIDIFIGSIADEIDNKISYTDKQFRIDQKKYGTQSALANLQWKIASRLLRDCGAKKIKTTYR